MSIPQNIWYKILYARNSYKNNKKSSLKNLKIWKVNCTYDVISTLYLLLVHVVELSLALIELVEVGHFKGYPSMCLVDFDS